MVRMDDGGDVRKCWLDCEELQRLKRVAAEADWEREIVRQLMGWCGFRASEVTYPGDAHLRWSEDADGWLLEVRGKDTTGGDQKLRDAWLPEAVEANVRRFSRERDRETGEAWVQTSTTTVRRWVREAAQEVAESTAQPERWRRCPATTSGAPE
jgi:hypothetical protein